MGTPGIFVGVLMGYKCQKPRAVSVRAMLRAAEERRTKKKYPYNCKQVFLSAVACCAPHCQLSTQTCLSNKSEEKRTSWTSPSPIPAHGKWLELMEKGGKQNKSWFVLMDYSWDKQIHSQALRVLPLSFKGGKGRRRNWSGGGSKEQLGLSRRKAREVMEVRGTLLCFSKLPCIC